MKVALTGATGFIGSHVLTELQEHGHEVLAVVRDEAQADIVTARGAQPTVADLYDRPAVVTLLNEADGAIHTASPGDETSANLDSAVVDAAIEGFAGTNKPYIQISGLWIYGDNTAITEDSPFKPPALVAWKEPIERRILEAPDMRGVVIVSGTAYGDGGGGIPALVLNSPRDDQDNLIMLGTRRAALGDRPRCRPCPALPARTRVRHGTRPLRRWERATPDRRRTNRGGRRRSWRSRSGPRFRC